jgi:hypothetical protein
LVAPGSFGCGFLVVEPVEAFLWAGGLQVGGELGAFAAALSQVGGCLLEAGLRESRLAGLDGLVEVVGVWPHPGWVQVPEGGKDRLAGLGTDRGGVLLGGGAQTGPPSGPGVGDARDDLPGRLGASFITPRGVERVVGVLRCLAGGCRLLACPAALQQPGTISGFLSSGGRLAERVDPRDRRGEACRVRRDRRGAVGVERSRGRLGAVT